MKGFLIVSGMVFLLILFGVGSYVTNYNYGNKAELGITTAYANVQNVYSSYTNQVMEAAQISDMYKNDVKEVIVEALNSRYGDDGIKSAFTFIQESNPTLDSAVYVKLQQIIESGRKEFKHEQTRLLDARRVYQTNLGYLVKGFWLRLAGYPKIDLDEYNIIVSATTTEAFDAGVDAPLKIRE